MRDIITSFYETYPYPRVAYFDEKRMRTYAQPLLASAGWKLEQLRGKTILDGGCGTGEITCSMAAYAKKVVGIDVSRASLEYAHELASRFKLPNVHFRAKNILTLSSKEKFDMVTSFGVLHHTPNPRKGFDRLSACLKPGGYCFIGFYHPHGGLSQRIHKQLATWLGGKTPEEKLAWKARAQKKILKENEQSYWADRLANPRETYFRVGEIRKWFDENGFEIMGIQGHKPNWRARYPFSWLSILLFEITLLIKQKRFVIMVGKKNG